MWSKLQNTWESLKNDFTPDRTISVLTETILSSLLGVAGPLGYCKYKSNCPYKRLKSTVSAGHIDNYLEPGRVVLNKDKEGNYVLIGTGGNSLVYKGVYIVDKLRMDVTPVAVKVPKDWDRPDHRECFFCELYVLKKLSSAKCGPKLLGPVRLGKLGPGIVMELVSGPNLWQFLQKPPDNFTRADWLELAANLADCLHKIHDTGHLHNDLKMDNIIIQVQRDGSLMPKIIDYGHSSKLWTGLKFGLCAKKMPPCYAPEVCAGDRTTAASDIYTLGVALGTLMEAADLFTEMSQLVEQCVNADATLRPSLRYIRAKLRQLLALQNAAGVLPLTPENVSRIYRDDRVVAS